MTPYEYIQIGIAIFVAIGGLIAWTIKHVNTTKYDLRVELMTLMTSLSKDIQNGDDKSNASFSNDIERTKESITRMELVIAAHREKFDQVYERIIRLENTTVTDDKARSLIHEVIEDNKKDMNKIKEILTATIESIDQLKISIAVQDAIMKNRGK